jgi:hypothetical protein
VVKLIELGVWEIKIQRELTHSFSAAESMMVSVKRQGESVFRERVTPPNSCSMKFPTESRLRNGSLTWLN